MQLCVGPHQLCEQFVQLVSLPLAPSFLFSSRTSGSGHASWSGVWRGTVESVALPGHCLLSALGRAAGHGGAYCRRGAQHSRTQHNTQQHSTTYNNIQQHTTRLCQVFACVYAVCVQGAPL